MVSGQLFVSEPIERPWSVRRGQHRLNSARDPRCSGRFTRHIPELLWTDEAGIRVSALVAVRGYDREDTPLLGQRCPTSSNGTKTIPFLGNRKGETSLQDFLL